MDSDLYVYPSLTVGRVWEVAHRIPNRHTGTFVDYPFSLSVNIETVNPFPNAREIPMARSSEGLTVNHTCNGAYGQSTGGDHEAERFKLSLLNHAQQAKITDKQRSKYSPTMPCWRYSISTDCMPCKLHVEGRGSGNALRTFAEDGDISYQTHHVVWICRLFSNLERL